MSNHLPAEALACYSYWIQQVYGWGVGLEWKQPGEYTYMPVIYDDSMRTSRDITIQIALLIMFGKYPNPQRIIREITETWIQPPGVIRFHA